MSRWWVRPKLAMAPHDAGLASLGGLNHGRRLQMPPSPWVPKLWGPVCILTPTPNIRAPIRLQGGGLLAAGSGGCGVRVEASPQPAGAAGAAAEAASRVPHSTPNKGPAAEERAFVQLQGWWGRKQNFKAGSPFVTPCRPHPHVPGCIPELEGSCPGGKPLNRGSGYSRAARGEARRFSA